MPKTYRHLWPQVVSFDNLHRAWCNARRGKRGTPAVASFELVAEDELFALQDELTQGLLRDGVLALTPGPSPILGEGRSAIMRKHCL